jgi:arabinan endo-1,5-alpha-L-arabinosidase
MPTGMTRRQFLRLHLSLGAYFPLTRFGLPQGVTPAGMIAQEGSTEDEVNGLARPVHDPVIIKADDTYYVFCTGTGIPVRCSTDLVNWDMSSPSRVFTRIPQWAREIIPAQNDIWAPDISYYNGKYHLYYSVSTFGSNHSVIGLATNATLNFEDESFEWVDEGLVLESQVTDSYNCIDPNLIVDTEGTPWLAFGSFWTGIKMCRLDVTTGKPSADDDMLYPLARRFTNSGAVEAPFIIRKGDFYYLFVSFDFCCRGADSTYHVVVGRSEAVTGPYADRDGVAMLEGGGTQVTFPTERWRGPGHNAILQDEDSDYIVYHAYDAENQGIPTLLIDPLVWDADGWPSI